MSDEIRPEDAAEEPAPEKPAPVLADLPADPAEALPVLIEALAEARLAVDARTDDLQRIAAEFDNYRKRTARDRDEVVRLSSQRLVEALLPVLDSFDGALGHEASTPAEEAMLDGMQSTYQQLMDALGKEGLEVVPAVGEPFDPMVHEAVMGGGAGHLVVTAEMRRGYTLGGRVIRPAMVGVADADEEA